MGHTFPNLNKSLVFLSLGTSLLLAGCAATAPQPKSPAPQATQKVVPQTLGEAQPWSCSDDTRRTSKGKPRKSAKPLDCGPPPPPVPVVVTPIATPVSLDVLTGQAYDLSKNAPVTDSRKAEPGQGTVVMGLNDWQGEISGVPAAESRFTRLKIGMTPQEVSALIGQPDAQGSKATESTLLSFFRRSKRWEAVYAGQGRLVFSSEVSWWGAGDLYLTWIIHNPNEGNSY